MIAELKIFSATGPQLIEQTNDVLFWQIAKSVFANRIELQAGKFSKLPYTELLDEIFAELKVEPKKKVQQLDKAASALVTQSSAGKLVFHADSIADDDDEPQAGENDDHSKNAGLQMDPVGHDKKDEWDLAVRFRDIQRYGYLQPKQKKEMSEKAIQAVMDRAHESLGPVQKP